MAEIDRTGAANLYGLARVQRERRWLSIMDTVLALCIVLWIVGLTVVDSAPSFVAWLMPLAIAVVGAHRVLVTVERQRRERKQTAARSQVSVPRQLSRAGR